MNKDEALKMAIDALSQDEGWFEPEEAINACKEALKQPAQEPVGWIPATYKYNLMSNDDEYPIGMLYHSKRDEDDVAVYTHPHQWKKLNTEDVMRLWREFPFDRGVTVGNKTFLDIANAIEQELNTKNGFSGLKDKNT